MLGVERDIAAGVGQFLQDTWARLLQERHVGVHVQQLSNRLDFPGYVPANDPDHHGRGTGSPATDRL